MLLTAATQNYGRLLSHCQQEHCLKLSANDVTQLYSIEHHFIAIDDLAAVP
jgi:hypothetical protein